FVARLLASVVLTFMVGVTDVFAVETVIADQLCRLEAFSRPLRQTIVVIDQAAVEPRATGDVGEMNRRWINKILAIAGVQEGQPSTISAPRERISVVVAREDGTDLIRVFSGCSPTYSQAELAELKRSSGGITGQLERFFGRDVEHKIDADKKV